MDPSPADISSDDTRRRILAAAAELFSERGYAGTTTREIARAAGVNEVTIFRHFETKHNLLSEVIHAHANLPDLAGLLEERLTGELRQDLISFGSLLLNMLTERRETLRLMLCEAHQMPVLRQVMVRVPDQLRGVLARYFQWKMERGEIRPVHPGIAAQGFLGMIFAYGVAREMLDSTVAPGISREELMEQFVDLTLHGLEKPEGSRDEK